MKYWIVEHASYGTLADWDWRYVGREMVAYPKFQWTGLRNNSIHHFSLREAKEALAKCRKSQRRGMQRCYIVEMSPHEKPYAKEIYDF